MFIYSPNYPAQRSLFELKKNERILAAMNELSYMGNINIYLYKKGKLKKLLKGKVD